MSQRFAEFASGIAGRLGKPMQFRKPAWNDETRAELRELLPRAALGEVRMRRSDHAEILEILREIVESDCPEGERETFNRLAVEALESAQAKYAAEQAAWPATTDCDRLDRAEEALRERGIVLWQVSPCCTT